MKWRHDTRKKKIKERYCPCISTKESKYTFILKQPLWSFWVQDKPQRFLPPCVLDSYHSPKQHTKEPNQKSGLYFLIRDYLCANMYLYVGQKSLSSSSNFVYWLIGFFLRPVWHKPWIQVWADLSLTLLFCLSQNFSFSLVEFMSHFV